MILRKDGLQLTHLYTEEDGESHVEDVEHALEPLAGG